MTFAAIITIIVIVIAIFLFVSEWLSIDLVALMIMVSLILTGVISPEEGVAGFSNKATITVAFMFIISAAILKTGALQFLTHRLSGLFRRSFALGMVAFTILIAIMSAFINNTPVVAVFIPVVLQVANTTGRSASKMLIPLSYAAIWGGMCTLIGTSTNILVSGIAEKSGLEPLGMFAMAHLGVILVLVGIIYLLLIGFKLLPNRMMEKDLQKKFGIRDYITEIELMPNSDSVGLRVMDSPLVKELELDILQVTRGEKEIIIPTGDFELQANDILKVRCDIDKIKLLKDRAKVLDEREITMLLGETKLTSRNTTLVELVVASNSEFHGRTLRELDFRRRFRAIPLAIRHRKDIVQKQLYDCKLKAGDVILAEVKNHYIKELKKMENESESPFIVISEDVMTDFNLRNFIIVISVVLGVVVTASLELVDIMVGTIAGVSILVLLRCLNMKDAYESVNWQVVFLLAGSLSLGVAMNNSKLDGMIAGGLIEYLEYWGPAAILAGLYFVTVVLGELMSNNATAALVTPIAIATSIDMGLDPMPFLMTVMFASSASFMTPVGYQTNAMVYSAGQYKFRDFLKVGSILSLVFWLVITLLIPYFYPFRPL